MISQRQAGFDRNPAKRKDGGQKMVCICGERAKRLLESLANHIDSTRNDNSGSMFRGIVDPGKVC